MPCARWAGSGWGGVERAVGVRDGAAAEVGGCRQAVRIFPLRGVGPVELEGGTGPERALSEVGAHSCQEIGRAVPRSVQGPRSRAAASPRGGALPDELPRECGQRVERIGPRGGLLGLRGSGHQWSPSCETHPFRGEGTFS